MFFNNFDKFSSVLHFSTLKLLLFSCRKSLRFLAHTFWNCAFFPRNVREKRKTQIKNYHWSLFLCIALLLNEIYLPIKFHVEAWHSFKVMLRTKFKNENEQRAITPKVWSFELWFLCTALLLNVLIQCFKSRPMLRQLRETVRQILHVRVANGTQKIDWYFICQNDIVSYDVK